MTVSNINNGIVRIAPSEGMTLVFEGKEYSEIILPQKEASKVTER